MKIILQSYCSYKYHQQWPSSSFFYISVVLTCVYPWSPSCGSCYLWGNTTLTWEDARDTCSGEGGHLLKVNDEEEKQCIFPLLNEVLIGERVWIGGHIFEGRQATRRYHCPSINSYEVLLYVARFLCVELRHANSPFLLAVTRKPSVNFNKQWFPTLASEINQNRLSISTFSIQIQIIREIKEYIR